MASAAKYAHEDATDVERPPKISAEACRRCVRNIQYHPVLSAEWLRLADALRQLARLVQLEGCMPGNTKVAEAVGRNGSTDGTLWDQEQHENAIRILVEEAKVNLCLRLMNDFKKWCYDPYTKATCMQEAKEALDYNDQQLQHKLSQFEDSLGVLLWRALLHVETLQLMEVPLLIEHCALVLESGGRFDPPRPVDSRGQETVVMYYYSSLMKHAEALQNSELLAKSRESRLVHLAVDHVLAHSDAYPPDLLLSVGEGFAALCDNEDFGTIWEQFFPDAAEKERFLQLEEKLTSRILKDSPEKKKDIRPLLDFFKTLQRSLK